MLDNQEKEYIIFSDESDAVGKYFSNFYGGVLVGSSQYERVTRRLNEKKQDLNLFGEVKWSKVTERYLPKYEELMECFFDEIGQGNLKVRIMFTQNARQAVGLTKEDLEVQYYKLYYQFIKHAFGLRHVPPRIGGTRLRIYRDELPDTAEKAESFKGFLMGLAKSKEFQQARITIAHEDIIEVHSHDHVLLQCVDIVLGCMSFRLNDKHKAKAEGAQVRGKRTRAKEALYKSILGHIRCIHPGFNIGISTGRPSEPLCQWSHEYRHWIFVAETVKYEGNLTKSGRNRNNPT